MSQARNDPEFRAEEKDEYAIGSRSEVNGAAIAGGIAGALLAGPFIGLAAAAGAAYLAAGKEGDAGDWARKSGKAVSDVGKKIVDVEKENKILDKTTKELIKGASWVEKRFSSTKSSQKRDTEANLTS